MKKKKVTLKDPNAKAMWGRTRSVTFVDKKKYTRKTKYRKSYEE